MESGTDHLKEISTKRIRDQPLEPHHKCPDMATSQQGTMSTSSEQVEEMEQGERMEQGEKMEQEERMEQVEQMARSTEDTILHIGYVESYVNLVMKLIPLQKYYENQREFSDLFKHYDNDLQVAKDHTKVWRSGDSIIKGIRQTFKLAKEFEPEFSRKYQINNERIKTITENEVKFVNEIRNDITNLLELTGFTENLKHVPQDQIKLHDYFMQNKCKVEDQLSEKKRILEELTISKELLMLIDFLKSVMDNSSKIQRVAEETKEKTIKFKNNLFMDKGAFERHNKLAEKALKQIAEHVSQRNTKFKNISKDMKETKEEIMNEKRQARELTQEVCNLRQELRDITRELIDLDHTSTRELNDEVLLLDSTEVMITGFEITLLPTFIDRRVLQFASIDRQRRINYLQTTNTTILAQIEDINIQLREQNEEVESLKEQMITCLTDSDEDTSDMKNYMSLEYDFQYMTEQLQELLPAIDKMIYGIKAVQDMFDTITEKLGEMIDKAKEVQTEAENEKIKFIYTELSSLESKWKGAYEIIVDLDKCTKQLAAHT